MDLLRKLTHTSDVLKLGKRHIKFEIIHISTFIPKENYELLYFKSFSIQILINFISSVIYINILYSIVVIFIIKSEM